MKFTLGWLKDHLDTTAPLDDIVRALTALGLEVEHVEDRARIFEPFKVAYVERADKHPDADRLKVCVVDTGKEKLQVVCGAPNARTGMKGVFAPVGSHIPGTGLDLKKGSIRGQDSNGMLVSEREMGLSEEHAGIIEVPADTPIGTPFATLYGLDDPLIEIAVTPNRADCAGVRGIARDLAAAGLGTLKPLNETPVKGVFSSPIGVSLKLDKDTADACPLFVGRHIRGVKNGPSPDWLQKRLKAIGLRPISALVDITNYLSYDLCRPLHVFDADKIKGGIHIRPARPGETLAALDGKTYELQPFMTAVCDDSGVLGLGGVIGGESSGCTDGTVNVYLECAYFDPLRTARTGRALQINSDARYRFERGIDPAFTIPATEIATRLILELCGGEAGAPVVAGAVPHARAPISYNPGMVEKLAGFAIADKRQQDILASLGFSVSVKDKIWTVQPPPWRGDVEGAADIVEDIIRINGYDNIPAVSLTRDTAVTRGAETSLSRRMRRARLTLAARGLHECVTWSFMPHEKAALFGANDHQNAAALRIANPISADLDQMRPSILGNLIEAAARNAARGHDGAALFETGPVFTSTASTGQMIMAAGVRSGHGQRHWSSPQAHRAADLYDAKADALAVLESCGVNTANLQTDREAPSWYHPGRSGSLRQGNMVLAHFGEIHPSLLESFKTDNAAAFEIFLDRVPEPRRKGTARPLLALPPLQPVRRDFAFVVDQSLESETLARAVRSVDKTLITDVEIFDVYTGKGLPEGKKSLALAVTIQPTDKTLTDSDIESLSQSITKAAASAGAVLR